MPKSLDAPPPYSPGQPVFSGPWNDMDMPEDQYDKLIARCAAALQDVVDTDNVKSDSKPENTGLQDGMLSYYQSQIPFTDGYQESMLAREYFDVRDMLVIEKK